MKKHYRTLDWEIVEFDTEDVITDSDVGGNDDCNPVDDGGED